MGRVQLTDTPDDEFEASWSHNGRHVAFERADPGEGEENTRRDRRRWLRRTPLDDDARESQPDWSPDGRKIAFTAADGPDP